LNSGDEHQGSVKEQRRCHNWTGHPNNQTGKLREAGQQDKPARDRPGNHPTGRTSGFFDPDEAWTGTHSRCSQGSPHRAADSISRHSSLDVFHVGSAPRRIVHLLARRQHTNNPQA
jgi:hypothetical protein